MINHPTILLQLSRLNTKALDLVCAGNVEEGETLLATCLAVGVNHLQQQQQQQQHASVCSNYTATTATTTTTRKHQQQAQQRQAHDAAPMTPSTSLITLPLQGVFARDDFPMDFPQAAFLFYQYALDVEQEAVHDLETLLALTAYNYAMIHHHAGFVEMDFGRIIQARRLYEFATQHLTTRTTGGRCCCWPLLPLAVYNNLGHLASFFGDSQGMEMCRDVLERGQQVCFRDSYYYSTPPAITTTSSSNNNNNGNMQQYAVFGDSLTRARQCSITAAPAA